MIVPGIRSLMPVFYKSHTTTQHAYSTIYTTSSHSSLWCTAIAWS